MTTGYNSPTSPRESPSPRTVHMVSPGPPSPRTGHMMSPGQGRMLPSPRASTLPASPRGSNVTLPASPRGSTVTLPASPRGPNVTLPASPRGSTVTLPGSPRVALPTTPSPVSPAPSGNSNQNQPSRVSFDK